MSTLSAVEQIEQLEKQIQELKHQALTELKEKLAEAKKNVIALEKELTELTGQPVTAEKVVIRKSRRPSISDEDLKLKILKVMAAHATGLSASAIANLVEQDPMRVRKFIMQNPTVLKRQGAGPGTRFFLR